MLVVGCGVIGLTAGVRVREAGLGVRIVTAELPLQTTSSVAAAIWYPYKAYPEAACSPGEAKRSRFSKSSPHLHESGVRMREGVEIWRHLSSTLVERCPASAGARMTRCRPATPTATLVAPVIEMPVYLGYLMDRRVRGAASSTAPCPSLEEAGEGALSSTARGSERASSSATPR